MRSRSGKDSAKKFLSNVRKNANQQISLNELSEDFKKLYLKLKNEKKRNSFLTQFTASGLTSTDFHSLHRLRHSELYQDDKNKELIEHFLHSIYSFCIPKVIKSNESPKPPAVSPYSNTKTLTHHVSTPLLGGSLFQAPPPPIQRAYSDPIPVVREPAKKEKVLTPPEEALMPSIDVRFGRHIFQTNLYLQPYKEKLSGTQLADRFLDVLRDREFDKNDKKQSDLIGLISKLVYLTLEEQGAFFLQLGQNKNALNKADYQRLTKIIFRNSIYQDKMKGINIAYATQELVLDKIKKVVPNIEFDDKSEMKSVGYSPQSTSDGPRMFADRKKEAAAFSDSLNSVISSSMGRRKPIG